MHGQAQLGLVHHSVLRCWDLLSWAAGALEVFKLCCRVGKGVNLGQVVIALRTLNVLWEKAVFDKEVLLFLLSLDLPKKTVEIDFWFLHMSCN